MKINSDLQTRTIYYSDLKSEKDKNESLEKENYYFNGLNDSEKTQYESQIKQSLLTIKNRLHQLHHVIDSNSIIITT